MSTAALIAAGTCMAALFALVFVLALCNAAAAGDRHLAEFRPAPTVDPDDEQPLDLAAVRADDELINALNDGAEPPPEVVAQLLDTWAAARRDGAR